MFIAEQDRRWMRRNGLPRVVSRRVSQAAKTLYHSTLGAMGPGRQSRAALLMVLASAHKCSACGCDGGGSVFVRYQTIPLPPDRANAILAKAAFVLGGAPRTYREAAYMCAYSTEYRTGETTIPVLDGLRVGCPNCRHDTSFGAGNTVTRPADLMGAARGAPRFPVKSPVKMKPVPMPPPPTNDELHVAQSECLVQGKVWRDGTSRLVGVELEHNLRVSGISSVLARWGGRYDRDGSCGYELSSAPASGAYLDAMVRAYCAALANGGCDNRCGGHVHVEAGDMSWADMFTLVTAWVRLEPLYFAVAGKARANGSYCTPLRGDVSAALQAYASGDVGKAKRALVSLAYAGDRSDTRGASRSDEGRYRAINLQPWLAGRSRDRGMGERATVEFRLWPGSLDADRVLLHTTMSERLVSWARLHTVNDAMRLTPDANGLAAIGMPGKALSDAMHIAAPNLVLGMAVL